MAAGDLEKGLEEESSDEEELTEEEITRRREEEEDRKKAEKARLELMDTIAVFVAFVVIMIMAVGEKNFCILGKILF